MSFLSLGYFTHTSYLNCLRRISLTTITLSSEYCVICIIWIIWIRKSDFTRLMFLWKKIFWYHLKDIFKPVVLDFSRNRETFSKPRSNRRKLKPLLNKSQLIFYKSAFQEVKVLHLDKTRFRIRSIGWVYRVHNGLFVLSSAFCAVHNQPFS